MHTMSYKCEFITAYRSRVQAAAAIFMSPVLLGVNHLHKKVTSLMTVMHAYIQSHNTCNFRFSILSSCITIHLMHGACIYAGKALLLGLFLSRISPLRVTYFRQLSTI